MTDEFLLQLIAEFKYWCFENDSEAQRHELHPVEQKSQELERKIAVIKNILLARGVVVPEPSPRGGLHY